MQQSEHRDCLEVDHASDMSCPLILDTQIPYDSIYQLTMVKKKYGVI